MMQMHFCTSIPTLGIVHRTPQFTTKALVDNFNLSRIDFCYHVTTIKQGHKQMNDFFVNPFDENPIIWTVFNSSKNIPRKNSVKRAGEIKITFPHSIRSTTSHSRKSWRTKQHASRPRKPVDPSNSFLKLASVSFLSQETQTASFLGTQRPSSIAWKLVPNH